MSETKQCPQCQSEVSAKNHFCLECGFMFTSVTATLLRSIDDFPGPLSEAL